MNKKRILILLLLFVTLTSQAQELWKYNMTPKLEVSTNLLYDATKSINLGLEVKLSNDFTLKVPVTYNPWGPTNPSAGLANNTKNKFILLQPELRWWTCEPFAGSFFGLQGNYSQYNFAGFDLYGLGSDYMKAHRFQGWLWGAGLTYGYQFYLAKRWSLEATIGAGYTSLTYDKYYCPACGEWLSKEKEDYWGVTGLGLSIIYILK